MRRGDSYLAAALAAEKERAPSPLEAAWERYRTAHEAGTVELRRVQELEAESSRHWEAYKRHAQDAEAALDEWQRLREAAR